MKNTLLSVIVPCYNCDQYIDDCVNSLEQDAAPEIQIILIDDGSSDNTLSQCHSLMKKYDNIEVIHTENHGVSHARNIGLDHALGDWIMFVDSDDTVEKEYVQVLHCESADSSDYIRFGIRRRYVNENGEETKIENSPTALFSDKELVDMSISDNFISVFIGNAFDSVCGSFFRRAIIEERHLRFDETVSVREDSLFALKYAECIDTVRFINQQLYNYKIIGGQSYHYRRPIPVNNIKKLDLEYRYFLKTKAVDDAGALETVDHHIFQQLMAGVIHCASRKYGVSIKELSRYLETVSGAFSELLCRINYRTLFFRFLILLLKKRRIFAATMICKIRMSFIK